MTQNEPDLEALFERLTNTDQDSLLTLSPTMQAHCDIVLQSSEKARGVLTVLITSLVKKITDPSQDIRLHQSKMQGGYSGRTFDSKYITPFLKR